VSSMIYVATGPFRASNHTHRMCAQFAFLPPLIIYLPVATITNWSSPTYRVTLQCHFRVSSLRSIRTRSYQDAGIPTSFPSSVPALTKRVLYGLCLRFNTVRTSTFSAFISFFSVCLIDFLLLCTKNGEQGFFFFHH